MRIALGVHRVAADMATNVSTLCRMTGVAAAGGADLVVFSEAALTGFIGTGEPEHDRGLSQTVPGMATRTLSEAARTTGTAIAFGLYEIDHEGRLYDSALLIGPDRRVWLHYRRISPWWHGPSDDPAIYRDGVALPTADTAFGRVCMLLCGDLFDDAIMERARAARSDLVLVPFAREFDCEVPDEVAWRDVEVGVYAERAALSGATTALVNQIGPGEGRHFGGALAVSPAGVVIGDLDLHTEGLLYVDVR